MCSFFSYNFFHIIFSNNFFIFSKNSFFSSVMRDCMYMGGDLNGDLGGELGGRFGGCIGGRFGG
jgi:hypothetical protein